MYDWMYARVIARQLVVGCPKIESPTYLLFADELGSSAEAIYDKVDAANTIAGVAGPEG